MAGRPSPPLADRRSRRDRGLLAGVVRVLVLALLVGSIALGAVVFAPTVDDALTSPIADKNPEELPPPSGDPPPVDGRDPAVAHPDDPNESSYETAIENVSSETVEGFVHAEVNDRRADRGLESIAWDATVASVSRAHSYDMAEREYFGHTNPDEQGPYDRFAEVANYCAVYGENLALNRLETPVEDPGGDGPVEHLTAEGIAEGLVDQWMNSSDHREAILDDGWDRGGVGVYVTADGGVYATHNFCIER